MYIYIYIEGKVFIYINICNTLFNSYLSNLATLCFIYSVGKGNECQRVLLQRKYSATESLPNILVRKVFIKKL